MQYEENNEFPWHKVSSKWNAVAKDKNTHSWYLFNSKPLKGGTVWCGEVHVEFDETVQNVIGVDMSKWMDIPWEDSLMLRPGYEQQDIVETIMDKTTSDEEAPVISSSNTAKEYPVVKLKNLHKCSVGDIVRLKRTGELIEVGEYSKIGCSGCKFSAYDGYQHPCRKCGLMGNAYGDAYVDYKEPTETQGEMFANTEMKVYADLDDKTKQLLQVKHEEGKVEWLDCRGNWSKMDKTTYQFFGDMVYRVV